MQRTERHAREQRDPRLDGLVDAVETALGTDETGFAMRETAVLGLANEVVRRSLEKWLANEAQKWDCPYVEVEGVRYRRHEIGTATYHSLCGPLVIRRWTYRQVGVHNGPTIVPLELAAGIVEDATPAMASSVIQGYAAMPLRHYVHEMEAAHRVVPSRSTLERLGKRIGERIKHALPRIEPVLRAEEQIPATTASISIGLDRTTVPMAEACQHAHPPSRTRPYVRRAPTPIQVNYRMAYVATLAFHDSQGQVLATRRFAATPGDGPDELVRRLFDELEYALGQNRTLPLTIVQDGAPELWNLMAEACEQRGLTPAATLIDRFHVDERLSKIVDAFAASDDVARRFRDRWRKSLDASDTAMDRICRFLDKLDWVYTFAMPEGEPLPKRWRSYARLALKPELAAEFGDHIAYLTRHRRLMKYASARRRGLPIGSGVTEGACKSVVAARCKRSGQRWREPGLSACLELRTLHVSERLPRAFAHASTVYNRPVTPV